jgi:hypothetical protein
MEELYKLIQEVEIQSKKLKSKLNEKSDEVAILKHQLNSITEQKNEYEAKLMHLTASLEQKNTMEGKSINENDLHQRVDELVREIDECIAHLKQ